MRPGMASMQAMSYSSGRIEMADPLGGLALDQPVGADDAFRPLAEAVIDDQQMVGDGVVDIPVALRARWCRHRPGRPFPGRTPGSAAPARRRSRPHPAAMPDAQIAARESRRSRRAGGRHGAAWLIGSPPWLASPSLRDRSVARSPRLSAASGGRRLGRSAPPRGGVRTVRAAATRGRSPRRAAIACISRSCSGSWNSMTLPVSTSIRW